VKIVYQEPALLPKIVRLCYNIVMILVYPELNHGMGVMMWRLGLSCYASRWLQLYGISDVHCVDRRDNIMGGRNEPE
jgi:hypothetical protein